MNKKLNAISLVLLCCPLVSQAVNVTNVSVDAAVRSTATTRVTVSGKITCDAVANVTMRIMMTQQKAGGGFGIAAGGNAGATPVTCDNSGTKTWKFELTNFAPFTAISAGQQAQVAYSAKANAKILRGSATIIPSAGP